MWILASAYHGKIIGNPHICAALWHISVLQTTLWNGFGTQRIPQESCERNVKHQGSSCLYIDDIVIFAQTKEEHGQIVAQILAALKRQALT